MVFYQLTVISPLASLGGSHVILRREKDRASALTFRGAELGAGEKERANLALLDPKQRQLGRNQINEPRVPSATSTGLMKKTKIKAGSENRAPRRAIDRHNTYNSDILCEVKSKVTHEVLKNMCCVPLLYEANKGLLINL